MRILVLADLHCGHHSGLCPPAWWSQRYEAIQIPTWEWFDSKVKGYSPDLAIWGGDLIDGKGPRSGGSELCESSCLRQKEMAIDIATYVNAKNNVFTYGTPYHVSDNGEDFETEIAKAVKGEIHNSPLIDADGVIINVRHHMASSTIPYSSSALAREKLADTLWADAEGRDKANIILRGHVHQHAFLGGVDDDGHQWVAMSLPCLQLWTKFGGRKITGPPINYGVTFIETFKGGFTWRTETMSLKGSREIIRF